MKKNINIGISIWTLRESLGMSQRAFGKAVGLGKNTICRYECGELKRVNPKLLYGIIKLGGSLNKIF